MAARCYTQAFISCWLHTEPVAAVVVPGKFSGKSKRIWLDLGNLVAIRTRNILREPSFPLTKNISTSSRAIPPRFFLTSLPHAVLLRCDYIQRCQRISHWATPSYLGILVCHRWYLQHGSTLVVLLFQYTKQLWWLFPSRNINPTTAFANQAMSQATFKCLIMAMIHSMMVDQKMLGIFSAG